MKRFQLICLESVQGQLHVLALDNFPALDFCKFSRQEPDAHRKHLEIQL